MHWLQFTVVLVLNQMIYAQVESSQSTQATAIKLPVEFLCELFDVKGQVIIFMLT